MSNWVKRNSYNAGLYVEFWVVLLPGRRGRFSQSFSIRVSNGHSGSQVDILSMTQLSVALRYKLPEETGGVSGFNNSAENAKHPTASSWMVRGPSIEIKPGFSNTD